jgi:uncharacterized protein
VTNGCSRTYRVRPIEKLDIVVADPTDNRILECAVAAGSKVIASGDRHLLALTTLPGVPIQKPQTSQALSALSL